MEPMPHIRIRPDRGWARADLRELWNYRDLLYILVWRDIKVRYKQTALGAAWAVLQPLVAMLVFTFFLGTLAHVPSDGIPYPVFAYSGLLLWQLSTEGLPCTPHHWLVSITYADIDKITNSSSHDSSN